MLTVLEYAGSAVVGIFYITILVAMATRKTSAAKAGAAEATVPPPNLDPAA